MTSWKHKIKICLSIILLKILCILNESHWISSTPTSTKHVLNDEQELHHSSSLKGSSKIKFHIDENKTEARDVLEEFKSPIVIPARGEHTGTIIFLHGHGQSGVRWSEHIKDHTEPYMKLICPNANRIPVTFYNKVNLSSWFDFNGVYYPQDNNDTIGIQKSTNYVHHLIDEEIKLGIPAERIIISGISQGGLLALQSAVSFPQKLGGIFIVATWEPMQQSLNKICNKNNKEIPIFQCHVHDDPLITNESANATATLVRDQVSTNATLEIYCGTQKVLIQILKDMHKFCKNHIGPIE